VVRKSDPGYPLRNYTKQNKIALDQYEHQIVDVAIERIILLGKGDIREMKPVELMQKGLVDPIRLFPKQEPHKQEKLEQGRVRLIASVSLLDNIVDRCIFGLQNKHEIEKWKEIPSKPGMGFQKESVSSLIDYVKTHIPTPTSIDSSHWDWSVQGWELNLCAEARILLMGLEDKLDPESKFIKNLIRNRYYAMSFSIFILPSGEMWEQIDPNVMKSGLYITSSDNSRIGFLIYQIALIIQKVEHAGAMFAGDDTVGTLLRDMVAFYKESFGKVLKLQDHGNDFEFCSQLFTNGSRYSLNAPKLVFNLLHKARAPIEQRMLDHEVFVNDLGDHPQVNYYNSLLERAGFFNGWPEPPVPRCVEYQSGSRAGIIGSYPEKMSNKQVQRRGAKSKPVVKIAMPTAKQSNQHAKEQRLVQQALGTSKINNKLLRAFANGGAGFLSGGTPTSITPGMNMAKQMFAGSGDYLSNFDMINQNACSNPSFNGSTSAVITKREFLFDVKTTGATFQLTKLPLNPGQSVSFPWLSQLASAYEEYQVLGMVFHFKSTSGNSVGSTTTNLGAVIMATEYDPTKPDFTSKQAMEDYFFAVSGKPSQDIFHAVECKRAQSPTQNELYIRNGALTGTDLRWTDFGNFYIAVQGQQAAATLGELWVTYKVRLLKPRLPITIGLGGQIASAHIFSISSTSALPLGVQSKVIGPLPGASVVAGALNWTGKPQQIYQITVAISAATSSSTLTSNVAFGIGPVNVFNSDTTENRSIGGALVSVYTATWKCTGDSSDIACQLNFNANTIVGAATTDIIITELDSTVTN